MPFLGLTRSRKHKELHDHVKTIWKAQPGRPLPRKIRLPLVTEGEVVLGDAQLGRWQVIVFYRGVHCPDSREYLEKVNAALPEFERLKCDVIAVSCDSKARAIKQVQESGLELAVACNLRPEEAFEFGVYMTEPLDGFDTDHPFCEPAILIVDPYQILHVVYITNAAWALPEVPTVLRFIAAYRTGTIDDGIHGTHLPEDIIEGERGTTMGCLNKGGSRRHTTAATPAHGAPPVSPRYAARSPRARASPVMDDRRPDNVTYQSYAHTSTNVDSRVRDPAVVTTNTY